MQCGAHKNQRLPGFLCIPSNPANKCIRRGSKSTNFSRVLVTPPRPHPLVTNHRPEIKNYSYIPLSNPSCVEQTAACLASSLDYGLFISRLVVCSPLWFRNLHSIYHLLLSAGIHELVFCFLGFLDQRVAFFRQFTHLKSFKLEHDVLRWPVDLPDLCELMRHLRRDQSGLKRLVLPMPSFRYPPKYKVAEDAAMEFG